MIRVFCGICGASTEREINEAEENCGVCEMGAGMRAIDAGSEDRHQLSEILARTGERLLCENPALESSVVPAFKHGQILTIDTLDLLVLFFERIALILDSIDLEPSERRLLLERVTAYSDAGLIIPLFFKRDAALGEVSERAVRIDRAFRHANESHTYPRDLGYYLQMVGEIQTHDDIRGAPVEYKYVDAEWFSSTMKHPHPLHLLNRVNALSALTDVIRASILCDGVLMKARAVKYRQRLSTADVTRRAIDAITAWYGKEIRQLPSFRSPERMIAFRRNEAGRSFVDTVLREYTLGRRKETPESIEKHLVAVMEESLTRAQQVAGESYEIEKTILSGLFATLGGIVGGLPGAILGGVGGSAAIVAADRLEKARVAPWTSFFIRRDNESG